MATMPREPRSRIVLAVILTAAIGGMFLAGDGGVQPGVPVSSAPADQRVMQQEAPVAAAPSGDEILTFTGRDPFARDQKEKKSFSPPNRGTAPTVSLASPRGTSVTTGSGVAVSVGGVASSGSGSTRTAPTAGDGLVPDRDSVTDTAPDTSTDTSTDTVTDTAPDTDILTVLDPAVSVENDSESSDDGAGASGRGKPAKPKAKSVPTFQAYRPTPTKAKPVQSRGLHRGWSQPPRRNPGYATSGSRGNGNAWGRRTKCKAHPHSPTGCRR